MSIPLKAASTIMVTGPSKSGKSYWLFKLLKNRQVMFTEPVYRVYYHYGIYQSLFDEMKSEIDGIIFKEGMPETIENLGHGNKHSILILDDLMLQICNNKDAASLFVMGSHHRNLTIIYLSQNLFAGGSMSRTISLNCEYMCLFKNIRDMRQVTVLGSQIFPGKSNSFLESYKNAISNPFGYLFIDLVNTTEDIVRVRAKIFPGEITEVYELL